MSRRRRNHRRHFNLSCLLLLASICGCHSSAPGSAPDNNPDAQIAITAAPALPARSPAPTAPSQTTADPRPVIVAFGDSLTAGYGADPGNSYPDFLQQDLDSSGYHYRVVNLGISGNTTKDGVDRLQDVLALKPLVVIVEFGGNDGLRGLPITATRDNLDQILKTITQSGAHVVLAGITLPPNYGPEYIHQINETFALAAKKYQLPWLPFLLIHVYDTPGSMQADGIHATAQGNQQVARNVLPLVTPFLKKSQPSH